MTKRDVHFAQFAQLLARELTDAGVFFDATGQGQHIIAQRAYDLVYHTLMHSTPASGSSIRKYQGFSIPEIANAIPDLTQMPD